MTTMNAPSALFIATADGHVARASGVSPSTATYQDISPTASQRTGLGTTLKLVADPHLYKRFILLGSQGGLMTSDATAATIAWNPINLASVSGTGWVQDIATVATDGGLTNESYAIHGTSTNPDQSGAFTTNVGWQQTLIRDTSGGGDSNLQSILVGKTFSSSSTLTKAVATFDRSTGTDIGSGVIFVELIGYLSGVQVFRQTSSQPGPTGTNLTHTWTGSQMVDRVLFNSNMGSAHYPSDPGGTCTLKNIHLEGLGANPFDAFISDIAASPNRQNYFGWLSKQTIFSIDYIFYNYTPDLFTTIHSTPVAKYSASMIYSIVAAPFTLNAGAAGKVWVTAGDPASGDAAIYESADWGAHFTALGTPSLNAGGGAIDLPFSLPGGVLGATAQNLVTLQKVT
ncbi:MAG: hypothetical protein ABI947_14510 [Chloroflexota bacterium]